MFSYRVDSKMRLELLYPTSFKSYSHFLTLTIFEITHFSTSVPATQ